MFNSPSLDDSLESVTFSNSNNVNHFVGVEDRFDSNFLFEQIIAEVDLLLDASSVNLNFEDVIFLLSHVGE